VTSVRRKHSTGHYVASVLTKVWRHPSNEGRRVRAVARSVGWQLQKRITGKPRRISFGPYQIMCYPDTGSAANVIYFTERFDPVEFAFLDRYLRPGDNVVDVGANVGLYSLWAANLIGEAGEVHAFEAAPRTVTRLRENLALNDLQSRVVVHEAAVSDVEGELEFYVDLDVSNQVVPAGTQAPGQSRVETVRAAALAEVLPDIEYSLGKVDVEGMEVLALKGWAPVLERGNPPVLLLEVLSGQLGKHRTTPEVLASFLKELGYGLFSFDPSRFTLQERPMTGARGNVIAVHLTQLSFVTDRVTPGQPVV